MTVGELRKALEGVPDDVQVMLREGDIYDLYDINKAELVQTHKRVSVGVHTITRTYAVEPYDKGTEPYGQAFLID